MSYLWRLTFFVKNFSVLPSLLSHIDQKFQLSISKRHSPAVFVVVWGARYCTVFAAGISVLKIRLSQLQLPTSTLWIPLRTLFALIDLHMSIYIPAYLSSSLKVINVLCFFCVAVLAHSKCCYFVVIIIIRNNMALHL